ncbi:acyltransferase family protein [Enterococcus sp. LJL128]
MEKKMSSEQRYPLLDIGQFAASLLVILVHCGRLAENDGLHFILKSLLGRLAVPLFLVSTGYFYRRKLLFSAAYSKIYFKKQIKVYLFWSLFYVPYGLWFLHTQGLPPAVYPAALAVGLLYTGLCYQLWYFPALFSALYLVKKSLLKLGYLKTFFLSFVLFALGAVETYSGYLSGTFIEKPFRLYQSVFATTRNGLFYAFIFVLLGFFLADYQQSPLLQKRVGAKLGFSGILLLVEGWLIFNNQGADKNFLFSLIPAAFFLVAVLIQSDKWQTRDFSNLRILGQYLFFLHPLFLEVIKELFSLTGIREFQGIPLFILTLFLSLAVSHVIVKLKNNNQGSKVQMQKKQLTAIREDNHG